MKFLIDMPVTPQAVPHLQAKSHEAVHASTIGLATVTDNEIIERARAEGRIIVTADVDYLCPTSSAQRRALCPPCRVAAASLELTDRLEGRDGS